MATRSEIISGDLQSYCQMNMTPLSKPLLKLDAFAKTIPNGENLASSLEQANFIQILLQSIKARHVLEVGTFVGFSAAAMALVLPKDGEVVTCERDAKIIEQSKPLWHEVGVAEKIKVLLGDAELNLKKLLQENAIFDLCFIDANKTAYLEYYEACVQLTRPGGLIVIDNTLWKGRVLNKNDQTNQTAAIRKVNEKVAQDSRVQALILPLSDGVTLAYRKAV